jgi:glutathione S-transferase
MNRLHLIIGNRNYSSWSLRVWIAMTMAGLAFDETIIPLYQPGTTRLISRHSKAGRVPVLHHGNLVIWESLAILEYLAETFPGRTWWPRGRAARATARAAASEMHSSFHGLRNACPMNFQRPRKKIALSEQALADVARIESLWRRCRREFAGRGRYLFGSFCNADAMFAPVVARFDTYDLDVARDTRDYMETIMAMDAFARWKVAAQKETWIAPPAEVD